jgi:hypothetical protein
LLSEGLGAWNYELLCVENKSKLFVLFYEFAQFSLINFVFKSFLFALKKVYKINLIIAIQNYQKKLS